MKDLSKPKFSIYVNDSDEDIINKLIKTQGKVKSAGLSNIDKILTRLIKQLKAYSKNKEN